MRRASRLGDGSDAITLAGVTGGTLFAGYFWTSTCAGTCTVTRVPVTGGATEIVATDTGAIIGVDASSLYLEQADSTGHRDRVLAMRADASVETLTDYLDQPSSPGVHFASTGDELFWTTTGAGLQRLSRAGGVPVVVPGVMTFGPFAVTADAILYNFSEEGYASVSR